MISNAQSTKGELVKLAMADFVGITDEDTMLGDEHGPGGSRGGGRRPGGLGRGGG